MIKLVNGGVYYMNGAIVKENVARIARHNVRKHNSGGKSVGNERVFSALHAHELP